MTETPQDFDFDAWLDGAERPERGVTVYQKAGLIAKLDRLGEQISNADEDAEVDGPSMAGGVGRLRAEYAATAQAFHDSALHIRVQGRSDDEKRELAAANLGTKPGDLGYLILADAIVAPRITAEQLKRLDKKVGPSQFGLILEAYRAASEDVPVVSADFLPRPSTRGDGGE